MCKSAFIILQGDVIQYKKLYRLESKANDEKDQERF